MESRTKNGHGALPFYGFHRPFFAFVFSTLLGEVASTEMHVSDGYFGCGCCDLLGAAALIPLSYYCTSIAAVFLVFLYNFLEIHFLSDLITGFRGHPVVLSFHPDSWLYELVVSKCSVLHGRYRATPWLASPHLQTAFLGYFGRHPQFDYQREIFRTPDGGTIALDWLRTCYVSREDMVSVDDSSDAKQPIVMIIPGITSDSSTSYVKHFAFKMARLGWNICVVNHRGYFVPVTVKYLGENGTDVPITGAVAISSPWDLLLGDRFLHRRFLQKLYSRAITKSLKRYAKLHQSIFSRLASWERITKARTLREFDCCATSLIAKFKTTDAYYRSSSSVNVVQNVAIPLLSLSALDDPVCTSEAIPWDECRVNKNIVLAITKHGGHVAYYEGLSACNMWWIRASSEFLGILHSARK